MDLTAKIREGFQSSAHRGATGELPPQEKDDTVTRDGHRLAQMICNKLEPFPKQLTAPTLGERFAISSTNNKTRTLTDISYAVAAPTILSNGSTTGRVPNGLRDARGFLETKTSTQRLQQAEWDDNVMRTYFEGKAKELELEKQRLSLHASPHTTEAPNPWKKSTHEHSNLSNVDATAYRQDYRSRCNLVGGSGNRAENVTSKLLLGNAVDRDALAEHMKAVREQTMPRGYRGASGKGWETTNQFHLAPYDVAAASSINAASATAPLPRQPTDDSVQLRERQVGAMESEAAAAFQRREIEHPTETKFRTPNVLDMKNGVLCMQHKFHHPRSDVVTGESYAPHEIVQGQYHTMSSVHIPAKNKSD